MIQTRNTSQRLKILEFLRSVKTHPSAEVVYEAVRKVLPTISLATVYRNLNFLADRGEVLKLEINNEFRFDGDIGSHQHCVCRRCGQLGDVFHEEISRYALDKVNSKDFKVDSVTIIYHGLCNMCNGGIKHGNKGKSNEGVCRRKPGKK